MNRGESEAGSIEIQNVSKTYGVSPLARSIIQNCSFTIERGKLTVMIGPSGCGKSTLVRLIAGFECPDSGMVLFNGSPAAGPSCDRLVVFQETALYPWMNTHENVLYGPKARGETGPEMRRYADFMLRRVGLSRFRRSYPNQLSGGMQRRAELARAMINSPAVMILDEPFRGLDAMTKGLMQAYYADLFEESRRTQLFVTTDIDEAIFLADRLVLMSYTPMRVRSIIDVNLPRPRKLSDVIESDHANQIKGEAVSLLHQEAMKAFASGSRAASDYVAAYSHHLQTTR